MDAVRNAGFKVVPIPGASAVVTAMSVAGMAEPRFVFEGFLPRRAGRRKQRLNQLASDTRSLVLFEAPHRLIETLEDMLAALGDRKCIVAREITKMHEDIATGRISDFIGRFTASKPRGEFVIVCEGTTDVALPGVTERALAEAKALIEKGMTKPKAARMVARKYGLKGSDLYQLLVAEQKGNRKGDTT